MTFATGWINGGKYFGELHPKTESQYAHQKTLAGILPWYGSWMQSRAHDEQMADLRDRLGLSWADIKSPWIAELSGNSAYRSLGSAVPTVSKNIGRLYDDSPEPVPEKRAHFSGRYGGRHRR